MKKKVIDLILVCIHAKFSKTVEIAQLWQHNRGNYTTPTISGTPRGTKVLLIVNRTF